MIDKIKEVLGIKYYPLNKIEISTEQLINNYNHLSSISKKIKIAPVVKSNAYGHGIDLVAKILDKENPPFFCVDSLFEAYQLKKANVKSPILIMGFIDSRNLQAKELPFSFAVFDLDFAKTLNQYQPGAKIHIKVDTGMNRIGVPIKDLSNFLKQLKKLKNLEIEGLMSHLSSPRSSKSYTAFQIENYKQAIKIFESKKIFPKWRHLAASGALFNVESQALTEITNLARCGIALYGASGEGKTKPVLELKSQIVHIKKLKEGDLVGYDRTFIAKSNTVVGILPLGYNDGIDRRQSNNGYVNYKGVTCPIIGRVSMNVTTIDVTKVKKPKIGDEIIVISADPKSPNSITSLARSAGTIPHDLLVHLHAKALKRIVI